MFTFPSTRRQLPPQGRLQVVQAPEDIELLVREQELLTGQSGRTFVIASADRLVYRVQWPPLNATGRASAGLVIEHLGNQGEVLCRQSLPLWEFLEHSLVQAQAAGQLFTPSVRAKR